MTTSPHRPAASNNDLSAAVQRPESKFVLLAVAFVACVVWIAVTRLHTADEPLERDICTQIMMGRVLADGGKLYVDTLEFKPPGMFVIWQIIHEVVGTDPSVVLWVNVIVTTLTLFGVFWAGSAKPWGRSGGFWAMCFWALICGDMMLQANQPNNEVFMNMFMVWGIALWVRADSARAGCWHYAVAGLFFGFVTLIKPVLATVICMALAWMFSEGLNRAALKRRARVMCWLMMPIAFVWGLTVLYFAWQGRAGDLYNCLVRYGAHYAGRNGGQAVGNTYGIVMNILRGFRSDFLFPSYMHFTFPLIVLTALGIGGGWRGGQRSQALTLAAWLAGSFLAVSVPGMFYRHYYQLYLPALALGAGWGVATISISLRQRVLALWVGLVTLILLAWHVVPDLRFNGRTWSLLKYNDVFVEVERCGHVVNLMLTADEPLYVWGMDPGVYYYSDRRPASGIFWADRLVSGPSKVQGTRKVIEDLNKNQPPLILVDDRDELSQLYPNHPVFHLMQRDYILVPEARFSRLFAVYIRRNSALASRVMSGKQRFFLPPSDDDPEFFNNSAHDLLQAGRLDEAVEKFARVLQLKPDSAQTHYNLANVLTDQGKLDEAIEHYHRALQINPDFDQAHHHLGLALAAQEKWSEAVPHYERSLQHIPTNAALAFNLGIALARLGYMEKAVDNYRRALKIDPNSEDALNNLAWVLATSVDARLRNGAEAVRLAERAMQLAPSNHADAELLDTLAAAQAEAGNFTAATNTAMQAIAAASQSADPSLAADIEQRLELYKSGRPYRKTPEANPPPR